MISDKPIIHFAHANGVPSQVYQKLFDALKDDYDIIYVPLIGPDKRYPITNHWPHLVEQIVDSIVQQAQGRKVIGLGHSLGSVLTLMACYQRPELFSQVIMLDPPLILGKYSFAFHMAMLVCLHDVGIIGHRKSKPLNYCVLRVFISILIQNVSRLIFSMA